jgi:hypothetical protein
VIKRRSEVVEKVSDEHTPPIRRFFADDDPVSVLARIRIELTHNLIGISCEERLNVAFEFFEVLARPRNLDLAAFERCGHELTSS